MLARRLLCLFLVLFLSTPAWAAEDLSQAVKGALAACDAGRNKDCLRLTAELLKTNNLPPRVASNLHAKRARAWWLKKIPGKVAAEFEKSIECDPSNPGTYFYRGIYYLDIQKPALALNDFSKGLELSPGNGIFHGLRGKAHYMLGDYKKAIADYNECVYLSPNWPYVYRFRSGYWAHFKNWGKAIADLQAFLKLRPGNQAVEQLLAELKEKKKAAQSSKAEEKTAKRPAAKKTGSKANTPWKRLQAEAEENYKKKNYAKALELLDQAIKKGPRQKKQKSELWSDRAMNLLNLDRNQEAAANADKALQMNPQNAQAALASGVAHYRLKNQELACKRLNRSIKLDPTSLSAFYYRGMIRQKRKQWALAISDYEKALELDPDNPYVLLQLSTVYTAIGQLEKSKQYLYASLSSKKLPPELKDKARLALSMIKKTKESLRSPPEPEADKASPTRPKPVAETPRSKLDKIMNAVVVISHEKGSGSGFFVDHKGGIITNYHVVGERPVVKVQLRDGRKADGLVVARRQEWDLALVAVPVKPKNILKLAKPTQGAVGTEVLAIGAPLGLPWTVSRGIISAIRDKNGVRLIQTDAPINPGNSGGPLIIKRRGQVVGVNTLTALQSDGLGFAVSAYNVCQAFPQFCPGAKHQPVASVSGQKTTGRYRGSTATKVFHRPGCRFYHCKSCTVGFATREEAISAGYRPCRVCKP